MAPRFTLVPLVLLAAMPAFAGLSVHRSVEKPKAIDVTIVDEPLSAAVKALAMYLPRRVQLLVSDDAKVSYRAREIAPETALRGVVAAAGAKVSIDHDQFWVRDDRQPGVTLDVKDEDIRTILKSMQTQCAIRNLVLDRDVQGKGTFLFDRVPCRTAFDVVFRTMGFASVDYGNSVVTVGRRNR